MPGGTESGTVARTLRLVAATRTPGTANHAALRMAHATSRDQWFTRRTDWYPSVWRDGSPGDGSANALLTRQAVQTPAQLQNLRRLQGGIVAQVEAEEMDVLDLRKVLPRVRRHQSGAGKAAAAGCRRRTFRGGTRRRWPAGSPSPPAQGSVRLLEDQRQGVVAASLGGEIGLITVAGRGCSRNSVRFSVRGRMLSSSRRSCDRPMHRVDLGAADVPGRVGEDELGVQVRIVFPVFLLAPRSNPSRAPGRARAACARSHRNTRSLVQTMPPSMVLRWWA